MLKPSMLWIFPIVALLTSCANSAQTRTAVATDCGFHFTGGSGLLGLLGAMGAFDRPAGRDCQRPISAIRQVPQMIEEDSSPAENVIAAPSSGDGQTVYSPSECIGAVVMGVCHGSILPDYSRPHPSCYGQMLNGICTGPLKLKCRCQHLGLPRRRRHVRRLRHDHHVEPAPPEPVGSVQCS